MLVNMKISLTLVFVIVVEVLGKIGRLSVMTSQLLVCLGRLVRSRLHGKARLTKFLGGLLENFLFMSVRCARMGMLRIDDADNSDDELE